MRVGLVQMDIVWGDAPQNRRVAEDYIVNNLAETDLVILPEMFSTGFSMRPERVAEDTSSSPTLEWMKEAAIKYGKAIVGSVAISDGDRYYNRLFFVSEDGSYTYYNKRHLFRMAGEDKVYSAGDKRVIVEYKGIRFLLLVCYDLRFPVWSRTVDNDYDAIIYIASWPVNRIYAWDTLLKARAIENIAYVIGVNRVGDDKANHYSGNSLVLDYLGREIGSLPVGEKGTIVAELDRDKLDKFRESFPAFMDSDEFSIC